MTSTGNPPLIFWVEYQVGGSTWNGPYVPRLYNVKAGKRDDSNFGDFRKYILEANSSETKAISRNKYEKAAHYLRYAYGKFVGVFDRTFPGAFFEDFSKGYIDPKANEWGIERIDTHDIARIAASGVVNFIKIRLIDNDPESTNLPDKSVSSSQPYEPESKITPIPIPASLDLSPGGSDKLSSDLASYFYGKPGKLYLVHNNSVLKYTALRAGDNEPVRVYDSLPVHDKIDGINVRDAYGMIFPIDKHKWNAQARILNVLKPSELAMGDKVYTILKGDINWVVYRMSRDTSSEPTSYEGMMSLVRPKKEIEDFVAGYRYIPGDDLKMARSYEREALGNIVSPAPPASAAPLQGFNAHDPSSLSGRVSPVVYTGAGIPASPVHKGFTG